jgi:phenylalanyl-tRNA synthetase beta chain
LLDGKKLNLSEDDLMICDSSEPIALAGIMGGEKDSILPQTSSILLEIANFDPKGVRRSATRYQVRTESANRNEKGLDTQRVDQAMAVANGLILQLYPNARLTAFTDCYPIETRCPVIEVSLDWLTARLGRQISESEARNLLNPLGFKLEHREQTFQVQVPSWRSTGDVSQKDDVLEEIARMIGYEHFDFIPPVVRLEKAVNQPGLAMERAAREYLAFQCGMQEIYSYPWVSQKYLDAAGVKPEDCLHLSSPPSPDISSLRPSLVPAMLEASSLNLRYFEQFRMFELAQVFSPGQTHPSDPSEALPRQSRCLTAVLTGKDPRLLFRQAKGILEQFPRAVMAESFSFAQVQKPVWADTKAWLNIMDGEHMIGSLGLISSQTARQADIKRVQAAVFEIDMEQVLPLPSRSNQFQALPQFPLVEQDFSVLLDEAVSWTNVRQALENSVRSCEFIEEYRGKQIPEGKKSMMLRVTFGSDEGTMTSRQIDEKVNAIKRKLLKLGGELRM